MINSLEATKAIHAAGTAVALGWVLASCSRNVRGNRCRCPLPLQDWLQMLLTQHPYRTDVQRCMQFKACWEGLKGERWLRSVPAEERLIGWRGETYDGAKVRMRAGRARSCAAYHALFGNDMAHGRSAAQGRVVMALTVHGATGCRCPGQLAFAPTPHCSPQRSALPCTR